MKTKLPFGLEYLWAMLVVSVCTGVSWLLLAHLELTNVVMIYLLGVLVVATRGSRGAAALASALGVLCFDFFFVPPRFTFNVSDTQYLWTFGVMFTVAMLISHLTVRLRQEAESALASEKQTVVMHQLSERVSRANGLPDVLRTIDEELRHLAHGRARILLPDAERRVALVKGEESDRLGEKALSVAQWVYDHGEPAGQGTSTLQDNEALYLPLFGSLGAVGVLLFEPFDGPQDPARTVVLLKMLAQQIGLALEVERLREQTKRAEVEAETERLRSSLLSSVSHDLRTPMAAVIGSVGALLEQSTFSDDQRALLENIQTESERLAHLVHNLLEATRLESGTVTLRKERYPLDEIIGSVLDRLSTSLEGRAVVLEIPKTLPAVPMDAVLVDQLLVNLIENVLRHTPEKTELLINAESNDKEIAVSVADRGPGLRPEDVDRVFEKFYHSARSPGAGLGLTICRAIVMAHGGMITASPRPGGGAVFRFTLPLKDAHAH